MSSDLKVTNIKHESSSSNNLVLASDGSANIDGLNVKDNAIVTDTNKYTALKTGELNSKGFVKNNVFCVNYYVSTNNEVPNSSWSEMGGSSAGVNMGWTVQPSTGTTGSTNSDQFGKFDTTNGRFTPTISGYYYIDVFFGFSESLSAGTILQSVISRNATTSTFLSSHSTTMNSDLVSFHRHRAGGGGSAGIEYWGMSGSVNLDTNDYVSAWVWHNQGDGRRCDAGRFVAFYLGENL